MTDLAAAARRIVELGEKSSRYPGISAVEHAEWMDLYRSNGCALAADWLRLLEMLRPFAEAARNAELSGRPPHEFVDAADYERALAALDQHREEGK